MVPNLPAAPLRLSVVTLAVLAVVATGPALPAYAAPAVPRLVEQSLDQGLHCRRAIQQAESGSGLPQHMLVAIARVESGRRDPISGRFHPWPWTINAGGRGHFFDSKAEAVAYTRQLQQRGVRSFDVGCMQVNMMYHPNAFQDLDEAFEPAANARYAVKFLRQLKDKTGSWETASTWYHSANPEHGTPYRAMVVSAMGAEARNPAEYASLPDVPAPQQARSSQPVVSAMRSMPAGPGTVVYLAGAPGGRILPQSYPSFANGGIPPMQQGTALPITGMAGVGRSLASYRMQPVPMAGPRLVASSSTIMASR